MTQSRSVKSDRNPFATEVTDRIPFRFVEGSLADHVERLMLLGFRGEIVGPKGTGKSTLLEELPRVLKSRMGIATYLVKLPTDRKPHSGLLQELIHHSREGKCVLLDGCERLSIRHHLQLRRHFRSPRFGIVVTRHQKGWLPHWVRCQSSPEILEYVLYQILDTCPFRENNRIREDAIRLLDDQPQNIRSVLRILYDRVADGIYGHPKLLKPAP